MITLPMEPPLDPALRRDLRTLEDALRVVGDDLAHARDEYDDARKRVELAEGLFGWRARIRVGVLRDAAAQRSIRDADERYVCAARALADTQERYRAARGAVDACVLGYLRRDPEFSALERRHGLADWRVAGRAASLRERARYDAR